MSTIVIADDGIEFDGRTPETSPLGGVESSVVNLATELARRGHTVMVRNKCREAIIHNGVDWAPIGDGLPDTADLYIANRGDKLIGGVPKAKSRAFWIHNPAKYLMKWRYLSKLWRYKPTIVFIGDYHATTYPAWAPGGPRRVIPYGIPDDFRTATPCAGTPGPRAVFTSNPLRSLDWLLDVWAERIYSQVPNAELHIFSGAATYGSVGDAKAQQMQAVLDKAAAMADRGVVLRGPVPKAQLIDEFRSARVMLYRGDENETFCLAVGEAQAMGVPTVVENLGSVPERVIDGLTGFVATGDLDFSSAAVRLLTDDDLWHVQHADALDHQRRWGWAEAAAQFEKLMEK